jgi:hypothetical protein
MCLGLGEQGKTRDNMEGPAASVVPPARRHQTQHKYEYMDTRRGGPWEDERTWGKHFAPVNSDSTPTERWPEEHGRQLPGTHPDTVAAAAQASTATAVTAVSLVSMFKSP